MEVIKAIISHSTHKYQQRADESYRCSACGLVLHTRSSLVNLLRCEKVNGNNNREKSSASSSLVRERIPESKGSNAHNTRTWERPATRVEALPARGPQL